jgi:hypothetical protein
LIGSKTTRAPAARASPAVVSVELLSQTTISIVQPSSPNAAPAARMLRKVAPMSFSSLKAGITTEIFMSPG